MRLSYHRISDTEREGHDAGLQAKLRLYMLKAGNTSLPEKQAVFLRTSARNILYDMINMSRRHPSFRAGNTD